MRTFVDMEMDDQEAKELYPEPSVASDSPRPKYPYGLCINLGDAELKKLGLDGDLPSVGDMLHGAFMAEVTNVSETENKMPDGSTKKCCRIELQITHLAVEDEDREVVGKTREQRAKGRYGSDEDEDED